MRLPPLLRRAVTEPRLRRRVFVTALAIAVSPLPLVGTLGYEHGLLFTAPMSLLGLGAGVDAARRVQASNDSEEELASFVNRAGPLMLMEVLALVGLVLAVQLVAQLYNPTCDLLEGLAFFGLGPVLSGLLGGVCGLWGAVVASKRHRRRQLLIGSLPMVASLIIGVRRIYADPVVFVHDPFWAYFAGPLYDEAVAVTPRYVWFRVYNVATALAAVLALHLWALPSGRLGSLGRVKSRPWSAAALATLVTVSGWFGLQPERHHFHATVDSLATELPGTLTTEHFVIHYDPRGPAAQHLELVAAEHEFAWHRLASRLGREPEVPVHSFVFPDSDRKRVLMGAGRTEVSPPWRGHLYLNDSPFPHRVLHHELAHSFSAPLGDPLLGIAGDIGLGGVRINLALVEGFAEALAQRPRVGLDLHDQAAVLHRLEKRPPLESLMGLSFWGKSSRHAYAAAGSFCLWLAETRGIDRLATLYGNAGDFEPAYGVPLSELEAEWIEFLEQRPIRPRDIEAQRQRYKKRAIFQRPCAHRSANLRKEARHATARGDHEGSVERLETVCAIEPQRTQHRITLAMAQARAGHADDALATLEDAAQTPDLTHTLASAIDERLGDLAASSGDLASARAYYQQAQSRSVSERVARTLQVKERSTRDPQLAALVLEYFGPFEATQSPAARAALKVYMATRIAELESQAPLGSYLLGQQLLSLHRGPEAAEAFGRALAPADGDEPLHTAELRRAAREGLLNAHVRNRDYAEAEAVLEPLVADPEIGNGHRYTYQLWSERIEFFREYRPPTTR
ncbi:MAG: tetratricopeptide repeat protein [Myxococcota bacterium]